MKFTKLLIVEDEPSEVETWRKQIDRNNALKKRADQADYASTFEEAKSLIERQKYDAAIIDIRLKSTAGVNDANASGNEVRDLLLASEIVVIAHLTGEPGAVEMANARYVDLVRVFEKASGEESDRSVHEEILVWLEEKSSIISTMRTVKSIIASKMAGLFYSSIWPRWDSWHTTHDEGDDFVPSSITRHISTHLYSSFLEDSGGKVHPEEWYFLPPSTERFHTGDVIHIGDEYYVLVTPRCDLERLGSDDTLLMAKLQIADRWSEDKQAVDEKIATLNGELKSTEIDAQKAKLQKKIENAYSDFRRKYYGHKQGKAGYHFLPEINVDADNSHGPFFVDFSNIRPIAMASTEAEEFQRGKIAALSPEFVPALVQRLGTFISRIGSPDYSHFP